MAYLLKILILEDLPADVEFVVRELKKYGLNFEYKNVDNRLDYINALDNYIPDVVLSDHNLPQFNSIEALEIFKEKKLLIPFILVTGTVSEEFAVRILKLGADDYILKENLTRLPVAIESALKQREQEAANFNANLELVKSEEKHRLLVSQASDAIFYLDENGYFLQVNESAINMLGHTEGEFLKMNVRDLIDCSNSNKKPSFIDLLNSNTSITFVREYFTKNKNKIVVEVNGKRLNDGRYLAIVRDITERGNMEIALQFEKDRLAVTLNSIGEGVIATDMNGKVILMNAVAEQLTEWKSKEAINEPLSKVFKTIHNATRKLSKNPVDLVLKSGNTVDLSNNIALVSRSGKEYIIANCGAPIKDSKNNIIGVILSFRNTTEKHKAEAAIKESENQYRLLFESAREGLLVLNAETGVIVNSNPFINSILECTSNCLIGKEIWKINELKKIVSTKAEFNELQKKEVNRFKDIHLVSKSGIKHYIEVISNIYFANNTKLIQYNIRDITDRKEAENLLEKSEYRLRSILYSEPECVKMLDIDGKLLDMNPAGLAMIEAENLEQLIYQPVYQLIKEEYRKPFEELMASVFKGNTGKLEFEIIGLKGTHRWLESHAVPFHDKLGNIISLLAITRDITKHKKAEQKLKQSEAKLKKAQEIANIGSWEINFKDSKLQWSDELFKIFGLAINEMTPTIELFISFLHPDDLAFATQKVNETLKAQISNSFNFRFIRKDGQTRYGVLESHFKLDENKNPLRVYGIVQDITQQALYEQTLKRQNKELKKTNSELDRFVYSTSHDLRAPLTSLLGLISILDEETDTSNMVHKEMIKMMRQSVTKLDDFIDSIINYSRNSRTVIKTEEINFKVLINEIKERLKFMNGFQNNFITEVINQEGKFISDKIRIGIVLSNLISNAIKYQDITKKNPFVEIIVNTNEFKATIEIEDNGIGIDKKNREKVFEMFFQGSDLSTGSGIGLYIVKETIEKLNGTIQLETEINKGSKFIITIPNLI